MIRPPRIFKLELALLVTIAAVSCNLPRDPDGTLDRVRRGAMRVGFVIDTPWVTDSAGGPGGIEPAFVHALARELGGRVEWVRGQQSNLLEALHRRELDLVIGGLTASSPWKQEVALTRPFYTDTAGREPKEHVLAASPGENAWLVRIEQVLRARREEVPSLLRRASP